MSLQAVLSVCALVAFAAPVPAAPPAPVVLENGARVILVPVAGATRIGVEVVHHVGSLHEPAGMPQLAHLVEHLTCYGATAGAKEGEAFALGQSRGSTNAETLPDVTRYEHEAPAEDLERILTLESDRLRGVSFTPALLAQESPRIDQEAGFVEASPMAPLMKYAFVAAPQAWFHGRSAAALSGATKDFDLAAAAAWRSTWYRPDRVTVAIVGGFEPNAALNLVRATIGAVPKPPEPSPSLAPWPTTPRRDAVKWTSNHTGLVIAFTPPPDPIERLTLTLLGDLALERLARDEQVRKIALVSLCTNRTWPVGDVPLFIYATLTPGLDLDPAEQERIITERFIAAMRDAAASNSLAMAAASLEFQPQLTWAQAQAQGKQAFAARPGFTGDAGGMILLFHALQTAMRDRVASSPAALAAVKAMSVDDAKAVVERAMTPEKKLVTTLTP